MHSWYAWQRRHKGVGWLHGPVGGMHLYNMSDSHVHVHTFVHRSMLKWHLGARTVPVIAAHLHNARSGALRVQTPPQWSVLFTTWSYLVIICCL